MQKCYQVYHPKTEVLDAVIKNTLYNGNVYESGNMEKDIVTDYEESIEKQ